MTKVRLNETSNCQFYAKMKRNTIFQQRSGASAYVSFLCCTSAFRSSFPIPRLSSVTLAVINWTLLTVWRFHFDSEHLAWFWKGDTLTHYLNPNFSVDICVCVVLISDIFTLMHDTNLVENMKSCDSWNSFVLNSDRLVRGLHRPLVCTA